MAGLIVKRPIVIIAAIARNGVIGVNNTLPWRLGSDLSRFRSLTMGKPVIMGRKTFESLPPARPGKGRLPGRSLVVMSRSKVITSADDGEVLTATSLNDALHLADTIAERDHAEDIVIAGGGDVFAQALPVTQRMHLTWVEATPKGDAYFPPIDPSVFSEVLHEAHSAGERDDHAFAFVDYERQCAAK